MKHKPDYEMQIMQRGLRDLARLSRAGQERVIAYWAARVPTIPETTEDYGAQQLDIEDRLPSQMPKRVTGAAA